ncbi:hypothetical protein FH972_004274 [Carpinus fangiana]|uniref:UDP-glycosyltransferases domain-containing protein n=1 Tax=Carpinus fangiana TaxID=176857 RepID=A0A5N6QL23_9ROSI|nr:hypothetical protein FH972_004274 [Carpinus fangiana]
MDISKPHAALLSSLGMGHLIPVVELGKRLVTHHNFNVTIFAVTSPMSPAESNVIQSCMSPKLFDIVQLPPIDISSLVDANSTIVTRLSVMMREAQPAIRSAISSWNPQPTLLIVDLFGTESLPIADELDMPKYVYVASNAWFLALTIRVPFLDKEVEGEIGSEIPKSDGILLNTWVDLLPTSLAALRDDDLLGRVIKSNPVYPIGPLTRTVSTSDGPMFDWLDMQPSELVIYVSFGSGGTLSYEQMTEIAWGLELSQQRFIWVVRQPFIGAVDAVFSRRATPPVMIH